MDLDALFDHYFENKQPKKAIALFKKFSVMTPILS